MELFKLFGTIAVNNTEANENIDETTDKAEKSNGRMSKVFSGIGSAALKVGKVVGAGMITTATAIGGLTKSAVENYAEYEQLVGGVETLFKDSSDKVIQYSNNAYKTAGMSANQYMETVTGFSASLLQSLDGDTNKAADKANTAIIDMSDNANKMGTSMESITNAYQGFAKQNYTMLDNLKLGYGGTKEEMARLLEDAGKISGFKYDISSYSDIVDAIHVVQTEMGITGTTQKEAATTIQGSIGMMKGAWTNFLTGMSDDTQDFDALLNNLIDSIVKVANNIVPRIAKTLPRIIQGIQSLIKNIIPYIPQIISQLLPALIQGSTELLQGLVESLPEIINLIIESLPAFIEGVVQIMQGIIEALPDIIRMLCDALPDILPLLIDAIVLLHVAIAEQLPTIIQIIIEKLPDIIASVVVALVKNFPLILSAFGKLVEPIISIFKKAFSGVVTAIKIIIKPIVDFFKGIWKGIKEIFSVVVDWFKSIFEKVSKAIHKVVDPWIEIFKKSWSAIKGVFEPVVNFFGNIFNKAWNGIKTAFSGVKNFFKGVWDGITGIFGGIADWFKNIFTKAWKGVKNVFSTGGKIFDGIKDGIVSFFKTIVNGIIKGINKVISVPFNAINGILKKIRDVSILGLEPFDWIHTFSVPEIPLLETGAVLEKGQVGLLEGNGAEAVVPLEKNKKWIGAVAEDIRNEFGGLGNEEVVNKLDEFINVVKSLKIYLDSEIMVGQLAPAMDTALGNIYEATGRGGRSSW